MLGCRIMFIVDGGSNTLVPFLLNTISAMKYHVTQVNDDVIT